MHVTPTTAIIGAGIQRPDHCEEVVLHGASPLELEPILSPYRSIRL